MAIALHRTLDSALMGIGYNQSSGNHLIYDPKQRINYDEVLKRALGTNGLHLELLLHEEPVPFMEKPNKYRKKLIQPELTPAGILGVEDNNILNILFRYLHDRYGERLNEKSNLGVNVLSPESTTMFEELGEVYGEISMNTFHSDYGFPSKHHLWATDFGFVLGIEQNGKGFDARTINKDRVVHLGGRGFNLYRDATSEVFFDNPNDARITYITYIFPRALQKNEFEFGPYDMATAMYSWGDVLKIVDFPNSAKRMLVLADTLGHNPRNGKELSDFLDAAISQGWGITGNPTGELLKLSRMLPEITDDNDASFICPISYLQLEDDKITANGGEMDPIIVRNTGRIEKIPSKVGSLWRYEEITANRPLHELQYETQLTKGEFLFLRTDGIDEPIVYSLYEKITGESPLKPGHQVSSDTLHRAFVEKDELLETVLQKNKDMSAHEIRDAIIAELGQYFIPRTDLDDDASLVIIKRAR